MTTRSEEADNVLIRVLAYLDSKTFIMNATASFQLPPEQILAVAPRTCFQHQ